MKNFFRAFCNYQQNDWYDFLFFVEFEINFVFNNFIIMISFLITKNYIFRSNFETFQSIKKSSTTRKKMKNVDVFVKKIEKLQKYFRSKLLWTQIKQKKQINARRHFAREFRVNDKIMLNVKFIKTIRFNKFLNYKNLDSYKIIEIINNCAYKLKLFKSMQSIFFVFHSWLLHLNESNSLFEQR